MFNVELNVNFRKGIQILRLFFKVDLLCVFFVMQEYLCVMAEDRHFRVGIVQML